MTLSEEDRMLATKYEAAGVNGSFFLLWQYEPKKQVHGLFDLILDCTFFLAPALVQVVLGCV